MGLLQEGLRRTLGTGEIRNALHPANLNPSEMKTNRLPIAKRGLEVKIGETSRMLSVEQEEGEERELKPQEASKNGFEPFVNPKPSDDPLFINGYNGNFAQKMELNRKGVERVLKIAHLDGQIILTSLNSLRQKENPLHRVIPVPEGWRIEINDAKLMEDLNEKGLTGEKRQKTFIKKFNQLLNASLFECIRKEKTTGIKDEHIRKKWFISVITPAIGLYILAPKLLQLDLSAIAGLTSTYIALNVTINLLSLFHKRLTESPEDYVRKLDARWEYLMPEVEVDKVLRSFLSLKARTLVKEKNGA